MTESELYELVKDIDKHLWPGVWWSIGSFQGRAEGFWFDSGGTIWASPDDVANLFVAKLVDRLSFAGAGMRIGRPFPDTWVVSTMTPKFVQATGPTLLHALVAAYRKVSSSGASKPRPS